MKNLNFNGQGLNEKGFAIKAPPPYKVAERDMTFNSVTARDGDIILDNGRYKNVDISYDINSIPHLVPYYDTESLRRELIDWLAPNDGDYKILRDDYNPGYFCKAVCKEIGEIKSSFNKHLDTTITFNRQPYWYSDLGQEQIILSGSGITHKIHNPENYTSQPLIRVYGKGSVVLMVNKENFIINIPTSMEYVDLDTELQAIFNGQVNCSNYVSFDYMPVLKSGDNTIYGTAYASSTSVFNKVEIIPRWRRL